MYTNEKYEAFLKASDEIELGDNKVLLTQIKEFYKKISSKFENSTARYKNAVSAILDVKIGGRATAARSFSPALTA